MPLNGQLPMQNLEKHAELESDYAYELSEDMNDHLRKTDYTFAHILYDGVYLVELTDDEDADLRYEGEFADAGGDMFGATDQVAEELEGIVMVDFPNGERDRMVFAEL